MNKKQRHARLRKIWGKRSPRDLAEELGVSTSTIRRDAKQLDLPKYEPKTVDINVADLRRKQDLSQERKQKREMAKALMEKELALEAALAVKEFCSDYTIPHGKKVKPSRAVAVALASDWHVAEVVHGWQTNGVNRFNKEVCFTRVRRYFQHLVKLIKLNQEHTQIDTLVLWLGGDLINNYLREEDLENNRLGPMSELEECKMHMKSGIQYLLEHTDVDLVIPTSTGNHGRSTKRVRISSEHEHSYEYFMYTSLADELKDEPRVKFMINKGYHTYVDVWPNYVIRFHHGHACKYGGGIGGLHIPLRKAVARWNQVRRVQMDCLGHFHQFLAGGWGGGGDYVVNGSLVGYNAYALRIGASPEPPQQAFFLIDEKVGKTIVCPIVLVEDR
jgi:hypothetical protein